MGNKLRVLGNVIAFAAASIAAIAVARNYILCEMAVADSQPAVAASSSTPQDGRDEKKASLAANTLPESERKFIWDIEQFALVLDRKIFPDWAAAIHDRDLPRILARMTGDLKAKIPVPISPRLVADSAADWFENLNEADFVAGNRTEFTAHLLDRLDQFRKARVQIRLMRLGPLDRSNMEGGWHGKMELRMAGESASGGPAEWVAHANFQSTCPTDSPDGWQFTACELTDSIIGRAAEFLMTERASERGFDLGSLHDNWRKPTDPPELLTGGIYVWDYNRDRHLDVLVTELGRAVLYEGDGRGRFRDVTMIRGLPRWLPARGAEAGIADLDNDGFEDLILGTQVFRNLDGKAFRNMAGQTDLRLPRDAAGFTVADYNRDGLVDIYVTRIASGHSDRVLTYFDYEITAGNQLWENRGNWKFRDVTEETGSLGGRRSCYAACWLDANDDGWPDVFIADEFGHPLLLVGSSSGRFETAELFSEFSGFCMGAAAGDLNQDGRTDLYLANMYSKAGDRIIANLPAEAYEPPVYRAFTRFVSGSELLVNTGGTKFEAQGRAARVHGVGWAYGPCLVDLDNDGLLDIYAPAGYQSVRRDEPDG